MKKLSIILCIAFVFVLIATSCCPLTTVAEVFKEAANKVENEAPADTHKESVPEPTRVIPTPVPQVDKASFCRNMVDNKCDGEASTFGVRDKIWFCYHARNFPENTVWRVEWYYDNGKQIAKGELKAGGTRNLWFYIYPNDTWRRGGAYLNLFADDELYSSYNFTIQ